MIVEFLQLAQYMFKHCNISCSNMLFYFKVVVFQSHQNTNCSDRLET